MGVLPCQTFKCMGNVMTCTNCHPEWMVGLFWGGGGGGGKFGSLEGKHLISVRNVIICVDKLQV